MGSHSYLMNLSHRGSCNNHGSGNITIGKGGSNDSAIINGSSDGCSGGNYRNGLQNLVTFTGALTNEPSLLNGHPVSDLNGVRFTGKLTNSPILPLENLVVYTGALTNTYRASMRLNRNPVR